MMIPIVSINKSQTIIVVMGNQNSGQKGGTSTTTQVLLKVKHEKIIIHHGYKMVLDIASMETFPHGLDGLRLWEAGIILARYVVAHSAMFKGKRVLQLGTGVGIAGIAAKKWTQSRQVQLSDYNTQVLQNARRNMQINDAVCPAFTLDWKNHGVHSTQYDIIMGSDIVYFGCPVEDLYQVFKDQLGYGGIGIIVIPLRKNYAQLFAKLIEPEVFELQVERLQKELYFQSALENQAESKDKYSLLGSIPFEVYRLAKKK